MRTIVIFLLLAAVLLEARPFSSRRSPSPGSSSDHLAIDDAYSYFDEPVAIGVPVDAAELENVADRTVPRAPGMLAHMAHRTGGGGGQVTGTPIIRDPELVRQMQQRQGYTIVRQVSQDMINTIRSLQTVRNSSLERSSSLSAYDILIGVLTRRLELKRLLLCQGLRMAGLWALEAPFQQPIDFSAAGEEQYILRNLQLIHSAVESNN